MGGTRGPARCSFSRSPGPSGGRGSGTLCTSAATTLRRGMRAEGSWSPPRSLGGRGLCLDLWVVTVGLLNPSGLHDGCTAKRSTYAPEAQPVGASERMQDGGPSILLVGREVGQVRVPAEPTLGTLGGAGGWAAVPSAGGTGPPWGGRQPQRSRAGIPARLSGDLGPERKSARGSRGPGLCHGLRC